MKKSYKGFCPPFIAIGFVVITMIFLGILPMLVGVAHASNVVPGSEVAPPGGVAPGVSTTPTPTNPPATTPDPIVTDPPVTPPPVTEPPATQTPNQGNTTPSTNPDPIASEPIISEPPEESDPMPSEEPDPVGKYPSKVDISGVKIDSPSIEQLIAQGANLEALLYPSGLKLPTKYMDLLMCAPVTSANELSGETANFLKTVAPTSDGVYTYAEYKAAELYLAICRLYVNVDNNYATGDSIRSLDKNTSVNWMENITNATLTNNTRLVQLISNYSDILEQHANGADISGHRQYRDFIAEHRGVCYSAGSLDYLVSLAAGISSRDTDLATHVLNLYSWWDYVGVTQNLTAAVLTYSKYYNEFAYNNINFNHGAPATAYQPGEENNNPNGNQGNQGGTTVVGPDSNPVPSSPGTIIGSSGGDNSWMNPNTQGSGDTPVSSVGGDVGTDSGILPEGKRNIREVASIAAVIFVIVAIIALWAIKAYRKGTDPVSRFLK